MKCRSRNVVVHDSVVLDSSIMDTEFINDSVSEPIFIASDSKKIVLV